MNKNLKNLLIIIGVVVLVLVIGVGGFLLGRLYFPGTFNTNVFPRMRFWQQRPGWFRGSQDVLTIEEAESAVDSYLQAYDSSNDLEIGEIMIFDNQAYAQIVEKITGIGAFEVLVDPGTMNVYYEQGASMMWNIKYGHMRGGMMGTGSYGDGINMPISGEEAISIAASYLKDYGSKLTVDDHADPFYGYYTIHTLENGEVAGMLSVNGYTGQVIIHTWHGAFIEMTEH